ncbi:MAG: hypothetical protein ACU0B1_05580 [Thermohalobaculum sp.]
MATQTQASMIQTARRHLVAARDALDAEIRDYPTPVSGCDAQYNHLLAERRRAHEALRVLESEIHIPTPRAP